jgi:hypothetical protein
VTILYPVFVFFCLFIETPTQHTYHFVDCQSGYCNFTVISLVDFIKQGWLMVIDNTWLLNVYCYNTNECDIIFIYYHMKCCKWYVNWRTYGVWSSFVYLFYTFLSIDEQWGCFTIQSIYVAQCSSTTLYV